MQILVRQVWGGAWDSISHQLPADPKAGGSRSTLPSGRHMAMPQCFSECGSQATCFRMTRGRGRKSPTEPESAPG